MIDERLPTKTFHLPPQSRRGDQFPGRFAVSQVGNGLYVQIEFVPEQAAGRYVGAWLEWRVQESCEQRQGRDGAAAEFPHPLHQRAQVAEVACSPVALGAERVQREEDPPRASGAGLAERPARGGYDERIDPVAADLDRESMVARGQVRRQAKPLKAKPLAVHLSDLDIRALAGAGRPAANAAVLKCKLARERPSAGGGR